MTFSHPLAHSAKVFAAHSQDGREQQILVIVTTAELDPQSGRHKKGIVEKLSGAARDYMAKSAHVTAFLLMNQPKDWRQLTGVPPPSCGSGARRVHSSCFAAVSMR